MYYFCNIKILKRYTGICNIKKKTNIKIDFFSKHCVINVYKKRDRY